MKATAGTGWEPGGVKATASGSEPVISTELTDTEHSRSLMNVTELLLYIALSSHSWMIFGCKISGAALTADGLR